jgi:cellulose synthase/poly-beta-1,6-N-acetylglucosamine synthase-like glycosyltransferase
MIPVTVVTPAYNEEESIGAYLDSLIAQTFQDFQVLLIDDGSTDNTVNIAASYMDRLRIQIVKMPRVGWKAAKARGTASVTTEFCIVNDADSLVDPHCFERIMAAFSDPTVGAVGGQTRSVGTTWVVRGAQLVRHLLHRYRKEGNSQGWVLTGACMAFRTQTLRAVGGLLDTQELVGQDIEISWRLQKHGVRVVTRDDAIVYHHEPETLGATFQRQYMFGRKAVHTYWLYKNLWTNWKLWIRFYPLVILLTALVSLRTALLMLVSTLAGVLWLFRKTDATFGEKLQGWIVFTVHSTAYTAGFLYELGRRIGRRLSSQSTQDTLMTSEKKTS